MSHKYCNECSEAKNIQERFYGGNNTIHQTGDLGVETYKGEVVAVWFRCQRLPFHQSECTAERAKEMRNAGAVQTPLVGVVMLSDEAMAL